MTNKNFDRCLNILARSKGIRDVFVDIIDAVLYPMILTDRANLSRNPIDNYKDADKGLFIEAINTLGDLMTGDGEGLYDALGDLFMEYLSFGKNGQFFTPQEICDMMCQMTLQKNNPEDNGKNVLDCACGSGRMLLGAAKQNRNLLLHGADIDITCVKMTALNLALNSLTGQVDWMNTLSMEHYATFHIKFEPFSRMPFIQIEGKKEKGTFQALEKAVEAMPAHQKQQVIQQTLF